MVPKLATDLKGQTSRKMLDSLCGNRQRQHRGWGRPSFEHSERFTCSVPISHQQVSHYAQMADTHYSYLQRRRFRRCRAKRLYAHIHHCWGALTSGEMKEPDSGKYSVVVMACVFTIPCSK